MPPRRELEGREPGREEGVEPRIVTLVGLSMMGTVWEKFNTVFRSGKVDKGQVQKRRQQNTTISARGRLPRQDEILITRGLFHNSFDQGGSREVSVSPSALHLVACQAL